MSNDNDSSDIARLLTQEIPEIADGVVEIKGLARKPGFRTKVALSSNNADVDCIGVTVGVQGDRIKKIVDQLNGERIDLVRWHESADVFIRNALQPAIIDEVILFSTDHRATILVREDQLSLAIGRQSQNRDLASKLCGWELEIKVKPPDGK
jgi:N utilization substance protein A